MGTDSVGNGAYTFWDDEYSFKGPCYITYNYGQEGEYLNYKEYTVGGPDLGTVGASILIATGAKLLNNNTNQEFSFVLNNIYDLGGNAGEWSTEIEKDGIYHRISGGSFDRGSGAIDGSLDEDYPGEGGGTTGDISTSSRPILYK